MKNRIDEQRKFISEIDTVEKWMTWRFGKYMSSEEYNNDISEALEWGITDVLYSFLAIYAIGMLVFYPEKYERTDYMIKDAESGKNVYSAKFIRDKYQECEELNQFIEQSGFVSKYFEIGNICPMWPGGNKDKGTTWNFDLPEIYFNKKENTIWVQILREMYKNANLDEVINFAWYCDEKGEYLSGMPMFDFKDTKSFLDSICSKKYPVDAKKKLFEMFVANRVVKIIEKRTSSLISET